LQAACEKFCHSVLYYLPISFSDVNALVAVFSSQTTFGIEKPTEVFVNFCTIGTFVDVWKASLP